MTDVGKDGEQDTMIFSELRVTKGLSWMLCQLEDSARDERTSKAIFPEPHSVGCPRLECEDCLKCCVSACSGVSDTLRPHGL